MQTKFTKLQLYLTDLPDSVSDTMQQATCKSTIYSTQIRRNL